jgi:hypothetical protein
MIDAAQALTSEGMTVHKGRVMLRIPDHPRAWKTGYVYRSIVVAGKMLGRPILPSEKVHHRDTNKSNDAPDNLEVCASQREHLTEHHSHKIELRCAGCDKPFKTFPCRKRARNYCSRPCSAKAGAAAPRLKKRAIGLFCKHGHRKSTRANGVRICRTCARGWYKIADEKRAGRRNRRAG